MASQRDHRAEVLSTAKAGGWTHDSKSYDGDGLVVDTFSGIPGIVRVVWFRTRWKESGRFAGAIFTDRVTERDRNVWTIRGKNSLVDRLSHQ